VPLVDFQDILSSQTAHQSQSDKARSTIWEDARSIPPQQGECRAGTWQ